MTQQDNGQTAVAAQTQAVALPRWAAALPPEVVSTAEMAIATGWYKDVKTIAQAAFKIMVGRELGISTIESMQYVHVIPPRGENGAPRIQLGYPVIAGLVQKSGLYRYHVEEKSVEQARVAFYKFTQGGGERKLGVSVFTMQDARAAGLVRANGPWQTYPATMLFARALTHGVKTYCPSVLSGADVGVEEPYIEGAARIVDEETLPPEVHAAPDESVAAIYARAWSAFWVQVRDLGLTKGQVHDVFGVPPDDGSLVEAVERKAEAEAKTLPEVIAEMADRLLATVQAGDVPPPAETEAWPTEEPADDAIEGEAEEVTS